MQGNIHISVKNPVNVVQNDGELHRSKKLLDYEACRAVTPLMLHIACVQIPIQRQGEVLLSAGAAHGQGCYVIS